MALGDPYITVPQLKTHAQIDDVEDDAYLDTVVKGVSRAVNRYCGRQFNQTVTATARLFRPSGRSTVWVDDFHTSDDLVVKTAPDSDGVYQTTIAPGVTLEPLNGVVDGEPGWPYNRILLHTATFSSSTAQPAAEVTAQWGWDEVPDDVYQATLMHGARIFQRRYSPGGLIGQGDMVFRISKIKDPDVADLLEPYRLPLVA